MRTNNYYISFYANLFLVCASLNESLFGETATAMALKEIRKRD
jgi:hypothetical protein